jgi:signal transduction histidine kinase
MFNRVWAKLGLVFLSFLLLVAGSVGTSLLLVARGAADASTIDRVDLLRVLQVGFLVAAVGLIVWGYRLTRWAIVRPITYLEEATRRVACGDLSGSTGIGPDASREFRVLADSFEQMCHQLANSHAERERSAAELEAALEERERIVARIHDGLAQTLAFLGLRLGTVKEAIEQEDLSGVPANLALMQHTVEQASQEIRRLMAGLQHCNQDGCTLEGMLKPVVARFEEQGLAVELHLDQESSIAGSGEMFEQVVRVVQEALTNAYKHAPGCRVRVSLGRQEERAVVRIEDDGPGFEWDSLSEGSPHFGLKVMQTRAEWLGGELRVESDLGQGTKVILRWPIGK